MAEKSKCLQGGRCSRGGWFGPHIHINIDLLLETALLIPRNNLGTVWVGLPLRITLYSVQI